MSFDSKVDVQPIIDRIAKEVVERDLVAPAIMFLESVRPLAFIGGQLTIAFFSPFLGLLGDSGLDYAELLSERQNVENLLRRIEEISKEAEKARKDAQSAARRIREAVRINIRVIPGFQLIQCSKTQDGAKIELQLGAREEFPQTLKITILEAAPVLQVSEQKAGFSVSGHDVTFALNAAEGPSNSRYAFYCPKMGKWFLFDTTGLAAGLNRKVKKNPIESMIRSIRCH